MAKFGLFGKQKKSKNYAILPLEIDQDSIATGNIQNSII